MAGFPYTVCDVFTDRPLAGNQLGVFTEAAAIPEELLQPLARELNFSETAFVLPATAGGDARIRIFSPVAELAFAGHPVLGTAFVLGAAARRDEVVLETAGGLVPVTLTYEGERPAFGWMRQPLPTFAPYAHADALLAALGVERSELSVVRSDNGIAHLFVALADAAAVAALEPDLGALARLARDSAQPAVGFNCFAGAGASFTTRMFAPADGVPEDPATGSAAGPLACHLARHGRIAFGAEIEVSQGAAIGRPSTLLARVEGSAEAIASVHVGGAAWIVARGAFELAPAAVAA